MPIKIKCPKCEKVLTAPDTLAGKRANCPSCKTTLSVPLPKSAPAAAPAPAAPSATKTPASKPAAPAVPRPQKAAVPDGKPPAPPPPAVPSPPPEEDVESLAASLLGDEPRSESGPTDFIEFKCEMCDEPIKMDIALAGKKAPCPECRRIIKVPLPTDPKKVDWKNSIHKPAGARTDNEPAPEGAWGTATNRGQVSRESLEEAGALPEDRTPVSVRTWIARGMVAAAILLVGVMGTLKFLDWRASKRQEESLAKAMEAVNKGSLSGPQAAVVHQGAGQYHLHREDPRSVKPDKGDGGAWNQFGLARQKLVGQQSPNPECDALLIDLAQMQLDLAGDAKAIEERRRMSWRDTVTESIRTIQAINLPDRKPPEGRGEGVRLVCRKLIRLNQPGLIDDLARQIGDGPVSVSAIGLEQLRAGNTDAAAKMLAQALTAYPAEKPKDDGKQGKPGEDKKESAKRPPLLVDVVALAHALGQDKKLPPGPAEEKDTRDVGKAIGMVFSNASKAREEARKLRTPALRITALVGIADLLTDEGQARETAEEAAKIVSGDLGNQVISPWVLARLTRLGASLGLSVDTLLTVAGRIREADQLRGWAQLQVFRSHLAREKGKVDEALLNGVDPASLSHRVARIEWMRHNTAKDRSAAKEVESWDDALKPFGHMGVAMGLQGTK